MLLWIIQHYKELSSLGTKTIISLSAEKFLLTTVIKHCQTRRFFSTYLYLLIINIFLLSLKTTRGSKLPQTASDQETKTVNGKGNSGVLISDWLKNNFLFHMKNIQLIGPTHFPKAIPKKQQIHICFQSTFLHQKTDKKK